MTEPRKHHSVPRSLLRQFAGNNQSLLFVYDKERDKVIRASPNDSGAERDFYVIKDGLLRLNWEPAFQQLDDRLAHILHALTSISALSDIGAALRSEIPLLAATQLLRTKLQRTSIADVAAQLNATFEPLGIEQIDISDAEIRRTHLQHLLGIAEVAKVLGTKDMLLLSATDTSSTLWISDNPVVMFNNFPYGHFGIAASGIEIYFPISPTRCLAFYCPSIADQIRESLDPSHPRPNLTDPIFSKILEGIDHETLVPIDHKFVAFLNELQVRQSSRFLYSPSHDLRPAAQILSLHPSIKSVKAPLKLGEMGTAPQFPQMPLGTFLLMERGHKHDLLPVIDRSNPGDTSYLSVRVLNEVKLSTIDTTVQFDAATLIVDRYPMRYMREVVVTREMREKERVLVVQHADPGLDVMNGVD